MSDRYEIVPDKAGQHWALYDHRAGVRLVDGESMLVVSNLKESLEHGSCGISEIDEVAANILAGTRAHTPGPWRVGGHPGDDSGSGWRQVLSEGTPFPGSYVCQALEADARLIAAAPDLLEALEAFLRAPSVGSSGPGSTTIVVQDFNRRAAQAAIAKAKAEG